MSKCIVSNSALNIKVVVGNGSECFKALIISLLNQVLHILVNENADICFCTECTVVTLNIETVERTYNTELNDLKKIICLRKSEVSVVRISICYVVENLAEQGIR